MMTSSISVDAWYGDKEVAIARLMKETGEPRPYCEDLLDQLDALDESLQPALMRWWAKGEIDDRLVLRNYSIRKLIAEGRGRTVSEAFSFLNWLVHEPEEAVGVLAKPLLRLRNPKDTDH